MQKILGRYFLKRRTRIKIRSGQPQRKPISFNKASKIGILIQSQDLFNKASIEAFVKSLADEGKNVKALYYNIQKKDPEFNFGYQQLTDKDLTILGKFKKYKIREFIRTEFDYIFSLGPSCALPFQNILANCKAKCRVGLVRKEDNALFEVIIKPTLHTDPALIISGMLFYLNKINN